MRKKLAGIHLLAPLSETDIVDYSRNLDRELIVNSTIVTDGIVDTVEKTNYIVTFEYDTTLDGGTHQIRRSIPTLELLSYTGENMSGAHWVNVEDMDYNYITSGTTAQQAFEELDEQLSKLTYFKHIVDSVGIGSVVSANDDKVPQSVVSDGNFLIVLGDSHNVSYANNSVIIGGIQSIIQGDNDSDIARSGSVDPDGYTIQYAAIVGGYRNYIYGNADYASIFGGDKNQIIDNSLHGSILGGAVNKLYGYNDLSCIISGVNSYIYGSNVDKARGGIFQSVTSKLIDSMDTVIIGGVDSILTNSDQASSIGSVSIDALYSNTVFFGGSKGVKTANAYASSVISSNGPSRTLVHRNTSNTSMIGASGCEMLGANNASIISSNGCVVSGEYVGYDTGNNLSTMYASVKIVSLGYPNTVNVDDVTKFSIGLNVIYNPLWRNVPMASIYVKTIDSVNNRVSFIKSDGSDFIFDNVGANDYILIPYYQSTEYTILSNTTDTFSFASPVNLYSGLVILPDYSPERLTVVNVSGYTTIKLKLVSTNEYITVPNNAYSGKKLIRYAEPGYSLGTSIIASNGSYISHSSSAVLLAANGCHITNTDSASSIIASGGSYITDSYQSIINGGGGNHITNARNAIIIGGDTNYILDCKVIDDAPLITTTMIGTINCHIMNSNIAIILNSDSSYIENCTRRTEDDSSPIGAYMLGTRFSTINDSEGCGIIGGKDNHINFTTSNLILASDGNYVNNGSYQVIHSSSLSKISYTGETSIGSSHGCELSNAGQSAIIGCYINYLSSTTSSVLLGGKYNRVEAVSQCSTLSTNNSYIYSASQSSIIGGNTNYITNAYTGIILGSTNSYIKNITNEHPKCAFILGCDTGTVSNSDGSGIIGGMYSNINDGQNSCIIGGYGNLIFNAVYSTANVIIGGDQNRFHGGGRGVILGGQINDIISGLGNIIIGGANNIAQNANNTVMIACDTKIADRDYALFTDSITLTDSKLVLKTGTGLGTYKLPSVGDVLMVESVGYGDPNIWGEVANLTWGKAKGGNDMTPIDINSSPTSISDYNTDPSKVVYFFNCNTFNTNTGSYYKTFYINSETIYPIGTIIYIILYRLASLANNTHGLSVGCGGTTYGFSSGSGDTSECRTVAFQKVNASEWIILSNK